MQKAKEIAQEVAREVMKKPGILSVVLRGSLVTGHFTERSDIDLVAIMKEGDPYFETVDKKGMTVHIRYFPKDFLKTMINIGNFRTIDYIINAIPLYGEENAYSELREALKDFPSTRVLTNLLNTSLHFINDAQAQLERGNYENAVFIARDGAQHIAKTLLFMNHITCFKSKNILPSFEKIGKEHARFIQMYKKVQGLNDVDKEAAAAVLFDTLKMFDMLSSLLKEGFMNE